jgi:hypothetical protein
MRIWVLSAYRTGSLVSPPFAATRPDIGQIDRSYGVYWRHDRAGDCQAIIAGERELAVVDRWWRREGHGR